MKSLITLAFLVAALTARGAVVRGPAELVGEPGSGRDGMAARLGSAESQLGQGPRLGEPLAGISPRQLEEFRMGLDDFLEVETSEEGLGPAFNGTSCAVCHNVPVVGGAGVIGEVRAAGRDAGGRPVALSPDGETLFQLFSTPLHGCQVQLPPEAVIIARRIPIPLFGAGLVEAIADETILALADPEDRDGDGISGRASIVRDLATGDRRVGRFGWKGQHATLLSFGADAYRNEMGITNDLLRDELGVGLTPDQYRRCDPFPDPEDRLDPATRRRGIDNFESFMKFLAPSGPGELTAEARSGEQVFAAVGCASCHVPALITAPNREPVFDRKTVPLFSDLLLHEVGTGDDIPQAAALPTEIRTPALWGLRFRRPLLHDGSAATIEDAILRHAGEADRARRQFDALSPAAKAALLAFLRSL
jgi:CxxC motif-containing protein (DUF1111 family)